MMRYLFFILLLNQTLIAKHVESYMYWSPHMKMEDSQITFQIQKRLQKKGWDLKNWDFSSYLPWLLNREMVQSWKEFKWWLGFDLPRKQALSEETAYCIFWSLGAEVKRCNLNLPKEKLVLVLWEPPVVEPEGYTKEMLDHFDLVFTWNDDLVDNQKFFKFFWPDMRAPIKEIPSFEEKKFCTLIASRITSKRPNELYSERIQIARFFEDKDGEFDLYGRGWEKYKNQKGKIPDKLAVLKNYKFNICYENTRNVKGYITEKIFDSFAAGVVPIYWGATNISDFIPKQAYIDRTEFKDNEELYQFLKSITKEQYETYLQAADAFLQSEKAKIFTFDHLAETIVQQLK